MKTEAEKRANREYMKRIRAEKRAQLNREIVELALDNNWENFAEEFAIENCPEVLITAKAVSKRR